MSNGKKPIKVEDVKKKLFPETSEDLEKNGQLEPIKVDTNGEIIDGYKRAYLAGIENLDKVILSPERAKAAMNIHNMTKKQRNEIIRFAYNYLKTIYPGKHDDYEIYRMIAPRYGLKERQVANIINPTISPSQNCDGKPLVIPMPSVFVCPDCQGELMIDSNNWSITSTGKKHEHEWTEEHDSELNTMFKRCKTCRKIKEEDPLEGGM